MATADEQRPASSLATADVRERGLIRAASLSKEFASRDGTRVLALDDVSFSVDEGEFVSVVGPSGCGKSTLMKIIAGLVPHTSGQVLLNGSPVTGARSDVGIVFQSSVLLPWRTVLENVLLPIEIQKKPKREYVERAKELLELVGLSEFADKYPFELSGGMQQRNSITRALIHDPPMLLMDEPFGALDAITREHMNVELLRIWQMSGKTVLFITHSIPEAVFMSDRVIVLSGRPGRIVEDVRIDLPRPRTLDVMSDFEFGRLTTELRRTLNVEGRID
jgi:NitT/TauT family transport system ATP-binding protein